MNDVIFNCDFCESHVNIQNQLIGELSQSLVQKQVMQGGLPDNMKPNAINYIYQRQTIDQHDY